MRGLAGGRTKKTVSFGVHCRNGSAPGLGLSALRKCQLGGYWDTNTKCSLPHDISSRNLQSLKKLRTGKMASTSATSSGGLHDEVEDTPEPEAPGSDIPKTQGEGQDNMSFENDDQTTISEGRELHARDLNGTEPHHHESKSVSYSVNHLECTQSERKSSLELISPDVDNHFNEPIATEDKAAVTPKLLELEVIWLWRESIDIEYVF